MKKILGVELGSTKIKAVLTDENGVVLVNGEYEWENILVDGLWSYKLDDAWLGLQSAYKNLSNNYFKKTGDNLTNLDAIGISAMMHGYLAFDIDGNLLAPFRTWRNTNTARASKELTSLFGFHVPMRWSVSQYYESVLDNLEHVNKIFRLNTLSGYIHEKLSGKYVLGVDDASGMFPLDGKKYHPEMIKKFNKLLTEKGIDGNFADKLPTPLYAGENAGALTKEGALLLDPTGKLMPGAIMCPPEGDMGTGMVATNTTKPRTANISAGTSGNLNVTLEKPLEKYYEEIDVISSPDGNPVALIHSNNCTNEINEWIRLFIEVAKIFGVEFDDDHAAYLKLFGCALDSDFDVGGLTAYNYLAGEPLGGTKDGMLTLFRKPDGKMSLSNLMQAQIYSAVAPLSLGMDILKEEGVKIDCVFGHGGYYKSVPEVGMTATSALVDAPVTIMDNAGVGGAWGVSILALYMFNNNVPLGDFLDSIFKDCKKTTICADENAKKKFNAYFSSYKKLLKAEQIASNI